MTTNIKIELQKCKDKLDLKKSVVMETFLCRQRQQYNIWRTHWDLLQVLFQVHLLQLFQLTILEIQCSLVRFPIFYKMTFHKTGENCNKFWAFIKLVEVLILRLPFWPWVCCLIPVFGLLSSLSIFIYFQSCFNHASWWFISTLYQFSVAWSVVIGIYFQCSFFVWKSANSCAWTAVSVSK